jgi:hypothetical protein
MENGQVAGAFYYQIIVTVVDAAATSTVVTPVSSSATLTWFQARYLAALGHAIRRVGWVDRYLQFDGHIWQTQSLGAISKVLGPLAVSINSDCTVADLKAVDWVADSATPEVIKAAQALITTVFPP